MAATATETYVPFLKQVYLRDAVPAMQAKFQYKNSMQMPALKKVVLNMGVGDGARDENLIKAAEIDLTAIAGQKCIRTIAKKSIAAFKVREGMAVGCSATLRGERMWEFLHRLIYVALPRTRDFRGVSAKAFDGRGNYTLGVREHIIFTEIDMTHIVRNFGLNVTIVTSAANDEEARELLTFLGMPFRK